MVPVKGGEASPRIVIMTTEPRRKHYEAVKRLRQIIKRAYN